jgi:hypothetical protein
MIRREERKFYDINQNPIKVVAGAFLEEGNTRDVKRRINPADPYLESRIRKDSWNYNEHSLAEKEATINAFELAKSGDNFIIWISPEDGKIYREGRLNIYLPVNKNGEWQLLGRGMPLGWSQQESLGLAERLLTNGGGTMDPIYDTEGVRRQPIGFKIEKQEDWIGFCKELMPEFMEFWDFIKKGGDVENKRRMERDVMTAMLTAKGNNYVFERTMAGMGNLINQLGGHGSSWSGQENDVYQFKVLMVDGQATVDKVRKNGRWICPICGREIAEGEMVCAKCGAKMK